MKKSVVACAAAAVVLGAAAGVTRFVVLPAVDQVPSGLDVTVHYAGTADLLDATALGSGDVAHAVNTGVPVTADRQVRVTAVSAGVARVDDHTTVTGPAGRTIADTDHAWAVDRRDLSAATAPAGWTVTDHQGLVAGFPLHPAAHDYPFWDAGTARQVTAHYTGTAPHAGRTTFVFQVSATGAVADARTKAALPPALPKPLVMGIAQTLPSDRHAAVVAAAAQAGAVVPIDYQVVDTATVWVDSATGVVVDQKVRQAVLADVDGASGAVELLPVADLHLAPTSASVADATSRASTADSGRSLIGTDAPLAAAVLAGAFAGLGVFLARRRRTDGEPAATGASEAEALSS